MSACFTETKLRGRICAGGICAAPVMFDLLRRLDQNSAVLTLLDGSNAVITLLDLASTRSASDDRRPYQGTEKRAEKTRCRHHAEPRGRMTVGYPLSILKAGGT